MRPLSIVACGLCLVLVPCGTLLPAQEPLFPFLVTYDAPPTAPNISSWLDKPAGKYGHVRIVDGHLATDQGRLKLWAANLCFQGCFPGQDEAEQLARRLASLGFNCMRMHHMDARDIWGRSENKTIIDPDQLKRLDYLIFQLKQNGIYTNLNLHVSRKFGEPEGFADEAERPNYDKGLDNFEPRMIELQKKYARDLLTHVNPYTGLAYTEDPAIAFVEINNENALYHSWHRGALNNLPREYMATFRACWAEWLRNKYKTTDALRDAWAEGEVPVGEQLLANGLLTEPLDRGWTMERDDQTRVAWSIDHNGPTGGRSLTVEVTRTGSVSWRPQFSHAGFALQGGEPYRLTFCARAEKPQAISVHTMMDHDPWQRLGLSAQIDLGPKWRQYVLAFTASEDDPQARLTFSQLQPGKYEFTAIMLRPGGVLGLRDHESLRGDHVPLMFPGRMDRTPVARRDFAEFLWDTEDAYWDGMYRYLKNELKVAALVSGTQLGYSPVHLQASLDYLDAHAYWQHPSFPGRPWDRNNWNVRNIALVNHPGGTISSLAARRVIGKPYTISEYNHPVPNSYAAEGFPLIAAFGGLQDWDGIYAFAYSHNTDYEPRMVSSYFDIKGDPTRLVHMPACHALFVRGDIQAAAKTLTAPISRHAALDKLTETFNPGSLVTDSFGLDSAFSLEHAIGVTLDDSLSHAPRTGAARVETDRYVSDTSQLTWDVAQSSGGYVLANTPRTKLFTGFVSDTTYQLGDVQLQIGDTRLGWATLSLVCLDGEGFSHPGRVLVAATGWMQNSNAELEKVGEDRVTLGSRWGNPPILCEGIPATITLPVPAARVTCYPLDESGGRRQRSAVVSKEDQAEIHIGPECQTLWYEVVIGD